MVMLAFEPAWIIERRRLVFKAEQPGQIVVGSIAGNGPLRAVKAAGLITGQCG